MVSTVRRFGPPQLALSLVASAILLTACGGGSGDSSSSTTSAAPQSANVSGVAAKGLMRNALVQAYAVTASGQKGAAIGSPVRTNPIDGTYTLSGLPTDTVILIEVVADSLTTVLDEATGQSIVPGAGFTLRAAVKAAGAGTTSAHVTPYSELAVTQALKLANGLSSANIEASNAAIVKLAGFNPLTDTPKFDANGKPLNESGAKLGALSLLAKNDAGCPGSQADKISCEVAALKAKLNTPDVLSATIGSAIDAAKTTWPDAGIKIATGTYTPPTDSTATVTGVTLAKAFFANLRSNARAIDDTTPGAGSLVNEWQKLSDSVKNHLVPLSSSSVDELSLVTAAVDFYVGVVTQQTASFTSWRDVSSTRSQAECSLYQDAAETTLATNPGNAHYVICYSTEAWSNYSSSVSNTGVSTWSWDGFGHRVVLSATSAANTYNVATRLLKTHWSGTNTEQAAPVDDNLVPGGDNDFNATVTFNPSNTAGQLALQVSGELAPGVDQDGNALGDKQTVAISLNTKVVNATTNQLDMAGSLNVYSKGAIDSTLKIGAGSFARFEFTTGADLNGKPVKGPNSQLDLKLEGSTTPGGKVNGELILQAFALDKSGTQYLPQQIAFTGSLGGSAANAVPLFEGGVSFIAFNLANYDARVSHETADNYVQAVSTVLGTFHVPTQADIKLSLNIDGTKWQDGHVVNLAGAYSQKDVSITLTGSFPYDGNDHPVTLKTANDLTLTVVPGQTILPLYKNGVEVARLDTKKLRIDYVDGTFERF